MCLRLDSPAWDTIRKWWGSKRWSLVEHVKVTGRMSLKGMLASQHYLALLSLFLTAIRQVALTLM